MTSFVRFIFVVLVLGILLNLVIVGVANVNSERHREARTEEERNTFGKLLNTINGRLRTADIAVETQIVHSRGTVEKTTLLVRQYYINENDDTIAMPVHRLTIDGDRLFVDGYFLDFDALFAPDDPNLQVLRGMKLAYIDHMYGERQKEDDRFSLMPEYQVPELTRIDPPLSPDLTEEEEKKLAGGIDPASKPPPHKASIFASYYELQIWQHLWDYIKHPALTPRGLAVTHLAPASQELKTGRVYSAMAGPDGISIRDVTAPRLLNAILKKAADMDAEANGAAIIVPSAGTGADKSAK